MNEELEAICFEIISQVGAAKSNYVLSIAKARAGDFEAARQMIAEGDKLFRDGHAVHMKLLTEEAAEETKIRVTTKESDLKGTDIITGVAENDSVQARTGAVPLLLLHAEDQMASAETTKLMALNFIDVYQELLSLKQERLTK